MGVISDVWDTDFSLQVKVDDDVMVNVKLFRESVEILHTRLPEFIAGYGIYGKVSGGFPGGGP